MSVIKKLMMTAAGEEATPAIENTFSTYVYRGNGARALIPNGLLLNNVGYGNSLYFTGSSYLQKNSDLSGNSDGKTFTFSSWVLIPEANNATLYSSDTNGGGNGFTVMVVSSQLQLRAYNTAGSEVASFNMNKTNNFPTGRFFHLLISVDLSSASKRHVYIDGEDRSSAVSWTAYDTSSNIDFTRTLHTIGQRYTDYPLAGNLNHLYLDYTYRDLSIASNRLIFRDANGGSTSPASLAALNPILYLPMTNSYSNGQNLGTGGNFSAFGSQNFSSFGTEAGSDAPQKALTWAKNRDVNSYNHILIDTERYGYLSSNSTNGENQGLGANFFPSGLQLSQTPVLNAANREYVSWTFRASERFFDVVTYTGTGSAGLTVSHNLGLAPGCIMVKNVSRSTDWMVLHRNDGSSYKNLHLNTTNADIGFLPNYWGDVSSFYQPTDSDFKVGTGSNVNFSGDTYVAYLFAHDPLGPSGDGSDGLIACGSYTGNGSTNGPEITLGWEPQWLLIKNIQNSGDWWLFDNMRGMFASPGDDRPIKLNSAFPEDGYLSDYVTPLANGFAIQSSGTDVNQNNSKYIYIAIRRGPMLPPESGTDVFHPDQGDVTTTNPQFRSTFPVDLGIFKNVQSSADWRWGTRLTERYYLSSNTPVAQVGPQTDMVFDYQNGFWADLLNDTHYAWMFRRAPGFFDVVAFTAGTSSNRRLDHNLGVAPEMAIVKRRDGVRNWYVYHKDVDASPRDYYMRLNATNAKTQTISIWGTSDPTATDFGLNENDVIGSNGASCIAFLFATLPGVSKVGSYTGNGSSQTIDCGFTGGARFVLIKRADSTGDWNVWDTARGIVSGNDPHVSLNTSAQQVTPGDTIDPDSSGFIVNQVAGHNINVSSASYIYLAIA